MSHSPYAHGAATRVAGIAANAALTALVAGALIALSGQAANAQTFSIPITNYSFENPATTAITTSTPGWTKIGTSSGIYNPYESSGGSVYYTGATPTTDPANGGSGLAGIDGENLGYTFNGSVGNGFSQALSTTFQAATSYTLTISTGNRNGVAGNGNPDTFAGSTIQLLAGSTVISSSTNASGPALGTFYDQSVTLSAVNAFSSLAGQTLSIRMVTTNTTTANTNNATDWDNVRLISGSAPEPGSVALAGIGLLGLAGQVATRRRRRAIAAA